MIKDVFVSFRDPDDMSERVVLKCRGLVEAYIIGLENSDE